MKEVKQLENKKIDLSSIKVAIFDFDDTLAIEILYKNWYNICRCVISHNSSKNNPNILIKMEVLRWKFVFYGEMEKMFIMEW